MIKGNSKLLKDSIGRLQNFGGCMRPTASHFAARGAGSNEHKC